VFAVVSRLRARRRFDDEGFTILELMVASGIMLFAIVSLAYTSTIAFGNIALGRQRQSATSVVNRTLEQVRALPFDLVKRGMSSTDLAGDTSIVTCSFDAAKKCFEGEQLSVGTFSGANSTVVPLAPHRRDVTVGPSTFHVSTYVTYVGAIADNVFRVTVIARWDNQARQGGLGRVRSSTLVHSPDGCTSTATHPFSAPCQAFLYATASAQPASITITGDLAGGTAIDKAAVQLPDTSSILQVEQTVSQATTSRGSAGILDLAGADPVTAGQLTASVVADNDPGTANVATPAASAPGAQASASATRPGGHSLVLRASNGDAPSAVATVDSQATPVCQSVSLVAVQTHLPCGFGSVGAATDTLSAMLNLPAGGSATLATVEPAAGSVPLRSHTVRKLLTTGTTCVVDGCVRAEAKRAIGRVQIAGLPSGVSLSGYDYLVELTGYSDAAFAESGVGAGAPAAGPVTGSVRYWNGTGYTTRALPTSSGAVASVTITTGAVNASNGSTTVQIPATTFTIGGITVTDTAASGNRTASEVLVKSPLSGTISYRLSESTGLTSQLSIAVSLGNLQAGTSYKAGPSA
jgi:hypothetical protein